MSGKVTDEWFLQLSHKYEVERMELKEKISETRQRISSLNTMQQNKDHFLAAVRKFMEMETLTPPLLRELIDHIDVYETQGTGKHRTQRITIFYRFVGYIDIPESPEDEPYTADTRQGVAVPPQILADHPCYIQLCLCERCIHIYSAYRCYGLTAEFNSCG